MASGRRLPQQKTTKMAGDDMAFFKNLGHYATLVIRDISKFGQLAQKAEPFIEAPLLAIYPPAAAVTRLSHAALGFLVNAAAQASALVDVKSKLTVELVEQAFNHIKALAELFNSHANENSVDLPSSSSPA